MAKTEFQHTAARRRLDAYALKVLRERLFQHTAARRRLVFVRFLCVSGFVVSTHSRPKAAGITNEAGVSIYNSFNTQPPEGGWIFSFRLRLYLSGFNTQPPEGGWNKFRYLLVPGAGFNTQPPEGGWPEESF